MHNFSKKSIERLSTVDEALQNIFCNTIAQSPVDFGIAQGIRTLKQQKKYRDSGFSKTKNSRHLHRYAIDIYIWKWCDNEKRNKAFWDLESIKPVAEIAKGIAIDEGYDLQWGPDIWNGWDAPHFQLSHKQFPDKKHIIKEIKSYNWD